MKNKTSTVKIVLAVISGLLCFAATPGSIGWWPLAWFALLPLLLAIQDAPCGKAFQYGLMTGLAFYLPLFSWILIVLGTYGHLPWWLSVPSLFLLAFYMSLYLALCAAGTSWMSGKGIPKLWTLPSLWVLLDYGRAHVLSGFPWQDLAYTQYRIPILIQLSDLTGHYGVTYLILLFNILVFELLFTSRGQRHPAASLMKSRQLLLAALILCSALGYNAFRYQQVKTRPVTATIDIAVIQGNIAQDLKWTPAMQEETLNIYRRLSKEAVRSGGTSPLIIWPETALPFYPQNNPLFENLAEQFVALESLWLLTGTPFYQQAILADSHGTRVLPLYYNSAILLAPNGAIADRYDKQHLVPFGEYVPFRDYLWFLSPLVESVGDYAASTFSQPLACQNARIGVLICYESIFPDLAARWSQQGANLLINITNDAWFGRSNAPWQHLSMAVFRAVETRKNLVRSANTGVSCVIDPLGRINKPSPLFEPFFLTANVPLVEGQTIFVRYHLGFVVLNILGLALALAFSHKNRQRL